MNADIRVYPDKEMKAIDMAEIVGSVQLANGIIQGCGVSIIQNALHINDGRILINGRLGVVTAGNIELPELEATTTCYLTAVCDLAVQNPFYIALLTGADKSALDQKKSQIPNFNAGNGVDYVILGTASVNPTTHVVSNWTPQNATAVSNKTEVNKLRNSITSLNTKVNTNTSTLNSHTSTLNSHGSTLSSHTSTLNSHGSTLSSHTSTLNSHGSKLSSHTSSISTLNTNSTKVMNVLGNFVDILGFYYRTVPSGDNGFIQLKASSTYLMIITGWVADSAAAGLYLVNCGGSTFAVKTISAATSVTVSNPSSNLIIKIANGRNHTARVALITLSGSRI